MILLFTTFINLQVDSLKCLVTEFKPVTVRSTNEVIIDNGTAWKWWPASEAGEAELKECDDNWAVCVSRHIEPTEDPCYINPFDPSCGNRSTTSTTTTTTRTPNKCIACGKSTWRRIGVGMEEGDVFVSMGCYGSGAAQAQHIEQKSCRYEPSADECKSPGEGGSMRSLAMGGHICSQCFCNEDGCNGSTALFLNYAALIGILFLGWLY